SKYDLVIKDKASGSIYFETGLSSQAEGVQEEETLLWGRTIIFQSWPKTSNTKFEIPFLGRFFFCLMIGFFCGLIMKIYLQKKKAYNRLDDISDVLKITSNEVLSNLIDIQNEYLSTGSVDILKTDSAQKDI